MGGGGGWPVYNTINNIGGGEQVKPCNVPHHVYFVACEHV